MKDNDVINVKLVIIILIIIIHKDVKVNFNFWKIKINKIDNLACDCHPFGIIDKQCDTSTGMCQCKPNVMGQRCDQCKVFRLK